MVQRTGAGQRDIIKQVEGRRISWWAEVSYVLLSVSRDDQRKFKKELNRLKFKINNGNISYEHNWMGFKTSNSKHPFTIIGFPYDYDDREKRNDLMNEMALDAIKDSNVLGVVVLGINTKKANYPYDVLAFVPERKIREQRNLK